MPCTSCYDKQERWTPWLQDRFQSTPFEQFQSQAARERARILHQLENQIEGRRQTVPFDRTLDLRANAENNVRSRWIEQGIWKRVWGPAWPKGTEFSSLMPRPEGPEPYGAWGHVPGPEPELEPEPEPPRTPKLMFSFLGASKPEQPKAVTKESVAASKRDTSASRPYYQFLYQVSKECEWIKDELQSQRFTRFAGFAEFVDIEAKAYQSVKDAWIEDKIWMPKWGELPGMTWRHEEPDEEEAEAPIGLAAGPVGEPSPDAVANGEERPHLSYPRFFGLAPTPDVDNDRTDSDNLPSVPGGVEAFSGEAARPTNRGKTWVRTWKHFGRLPTFIESTQVLEEPTGRILRNARASRVEKQSKSNSQAKKVRLQNQSHCSAEPIELSDSTGQVVTLLGSGFGDTRASSIHQQISPQRITRSGKWISLRPAKSSRVSKQKSKPKDRWQIDASPNNTTSELLVTKTWNKPRQRKPFLLEAQSPSVLRRSARVAAKIPKSEVYTRAKLPGGK